MHAHLLITGNSMVQLQIETKRNEINEIKSRKIFTLVCNCYRNFNKWESGKNVTFKFCRYEASRSIHHRIGLTLAAVFQVNIGKSIDHKTVYGWLESSEMGWADVVHTHTDQHSVCVCVCSKSRIFSFVDCSS